MPLELRPNDNAREARPSLWIFQGRAIVLFVIGVGVAVAFYRIFDAAGVEWEFNISLSLLPLALMASFVHLFVNGKAPSFAQDTVALHAFRFRQWVYLQGALNRPPQFWIKSAELPPPSQFCQEK